MTQQYKVRMHPLRITTLLLSALCLLTIFSTNPLRAQAPTETHPKSTKPLQRLQLKLFLGAGLSYGYAPAARNGWEYNKNASGLNEAILGNTGFGITYHHPLRQGLQLLTSLDLAFTRAGIWYAYAKSRETAQGAYDFESESVFCLNSNLSLRPQLTLRLGQGRFHPEIGAFGQWAFLNHYNWGNHEFESFSRPQEAGPIQDHVYTYQTDSDIQLPNRPTGGLVIGFSTHGMRGTSPLPTSFSMHVFASAFSQKPSVVFQTAYLQAALNISLVRKQ